jgi:allantoin racemase
MRILVINPNTSEEMTTSIGEVASRHGSSGTEVVTVRALYGPRSIEGYFEEQIAGLATVETLALHEADYDAFVIACYGDPAVDACREITNKPVIGIGEASMHFACLLGHKFSIVAPMPRAIPIFEGLVHKLHLDSKCASIRATDLSVLDLEADPDSAAVEMIEVAKQAIAEDRAEVICLGCAGMGPLDQRVEEAVGVPVLDGIACAVLLAEALCAYGKSTSKVLGYARPASKELVDCSPLLQMAGGRG